MKKLDQKNYIRLIEMRYRLLKKRNENQNETIINKFVEKEKIIKRIVALQFTRQRKTKDQCNKRLF